MSATIERPFHLGTQRGRRGGYRRTLQPGVEEAQPIPVTVARVHPLARRMALAIRCLELIQSGAVADAATVAGLAQVTRARMTQVLNLTLLAPDIQAALLDLPIDAPVSERSLRAVMATPDWSQQRRAWAQLAGGIRDSA